MTRMPARRDGLLSRSVGSETVVYDDAAASAHSLSPLATAVFGLCDGRSTVAEAAAKLSLSVDEVSTALITLTSLGLVKGSGMTRRSAMQKAGLVGVGALAVTIAAPLAAAHASGTATTGPTTVFTDDFNTPGAPTNLFTSYATGSSLDGKWTVGGGGVDVVDSGYPGYAGSAATSAFVDLNGDSAGTLTSVPTFGPGAYTLNFQLAEPNNPDFTFTSVSVNVTLGGMTQAASVPVHTKFSDTASNLVLNFTTTTTGPLVITSTAGTSNAAVGPLLDNVLLSM